LIHSNRDGTLILALVPVVSQVPAVPFVV
jgi:hypothetical protein